MVREIKNKRNSKTKSKQLSKQLSKLALAPTQLQLHEKNERKKLKAILIFIAAALLIILAILLAVIYLTPIEIKEQKATFQKPTPTIEFQLKQPLINSTQAMTYLPAVDNEGKGVLTLLVVEAVPGSGRTLVDIDNLLFWGDTQHSIRIAKNVASNITGIDVNKYDLVYNIYANASIIGGESAGAALTLATIAVLQNKSLRNDIIITGTINHDGTIGPVQAILPKAKAAKANNATLFLVPLLQSREVTYETKEHCEKFGATEFCTTEQIPKKINVSEESGITVIEVGTIHDAMQYFFKE
ncbi:MAG: S16 family serine protease [Candidatus Nanoarchaeia archaeon]